MRIRANLLLLIMGLTLSLNANNVHALDKLKFEKNISSPSMRLKVDEFLNGFYKTDSMGFDVAAHDLNADGINEYILKRKSCTQAEVVCTHIILGSQKDNMLLLSSIRAKYMMVGATSNYGVSDLLVFENDINDYDFDIYIWSPEEKMYILRLENKQNE